MSIDFTKKSAQIVKATPKLVDDLLKMNTQNRNIKKSHLRWIENAIKADDYHLTTQAIGVSDKGVLVDGQHRLMAIKNSGYPPVELLIITGLDEKSKIYIDQGAKRSMTDMLKIVLDRSVTNNLSSMVNLKLKIEETPDGFVWNREMGTKKVNLDEVVDFVDNNFERLSELLSANGAHFLRAGAMAAMLDYSLKHSHRKACDFIESVRLGENLTKNMPAYRLRAHILAGHKKTAYGSGGQLQDYKLTVYACLADSKNRDIESLREASSWGEIKMLPSNYPKNMVADADGKLKKAG